MTTGKNTTKSNLTITVKDLNKYLNTFEKDYFNNAVDDVIGSTGKKPYEVSRYRSWDHCYVYFHYLHNLFMSGKSLTPGDKDLACVSILRIIWRVGECIAAQVLFWTLIIKSMKK